MKWNLVIHLSDDLPMPTVRALVLVRDLAIFGEVEQVSPDILADGELAPGESLRIRLSSSHSAAEIEARIRSYEGMKLEIAGYSIPGNPVKAPAEAITLSQLNRIEELVTFLVLSNPSNREAVSEAREHLEALAEWAAAEHRDNEEHLARRGIQQVTQLLEDESCNLERVWFDLGKSISGLQDLLHEIEGELQSQEGKQTDSSTPMERQVDEAVVGSQAVDCEQETSQSRGTSMADLVTPEMIETFVSESIEHLDNADLQLLAVETEPGNREALNAVFRAFHTVKGSAGILGLVQIGALAHQAENLLDRAREGSLTLVGPVIDLVFDTVDVLKQAIHGFREGELITGQSSMDDVMVQLAERIKGVDTILLEVPQPVEGPAPENPEEPRKRLGEVLTESGILSQNDLAEALHKQSLTGSSQKIGEVLVKDGKVGAREVVKALRSQGVGARDQSLQIRETVKVDADRLDQLLDTIGELVIAESMVSQSEELKRIASPSLLRHLGQLDKITRELQEMGTSLRMVPIRPTFQKMARLVRDLAHKSGKRVELVMSGEDTELDKSVVDQIGDPLVHMIRNAVDHGIESDPNERVKLGKPEAGRIELRAYHKGGSIYIEVQDDGKGLDRDAILAKAIQRGLIREGDVLSDKEVFNLIFLPGFSTAKTISDVSGRGVGMDVVRKNVEALRGQVEIISEPGMGSVFTIRLPLTLAIIDGMVVRVSKEKYIVPTLSVVQSLRPLSGEISTLFRRGEMLSVQGEQIPLFRLDRLFDTHGAEQDVTRATVVVVEDDGSRAALMVDELLGQQQIVIKPLGEALNGTPGLSGGAIMPDGRVGLILDIGTLVRLATTNGTHQAVEESRVGKNGNGARQHESNPSLN